MPRLLGYLDGHLSALARPSVPGLLRFDRTAALVLGGRACLVPEALVERGALTDRSLHDSGLRVADWPVPLLDPVDGRVVILPPTASPTHDAGDDSVVAPPGSYELRHIYWPGDDPYPFESRARSLVTLLRQVTDYGGLDPQPLLEALVNLLTGVDTRPIDLTDRASWPLVQGALI